MKPEIILIRARGTGDILCFPWGLLNIASYLKKHGFQARVLDTAAPGFKRRFEEELRNDNVKYVGISALTTQARNAEILCAQVKKAKKNVLLGGLHYTICPEEGLEIADYVFRGEGERSLLRFLVNGSRSRIIESQPLLDLDEIPLITKEEVAGFEINRKIFTIMTSRGCAFDCTFCLNRKYRVGGIRHHSVGYVVDLMEMLIREIDVKIFFLGDDIFTAYKEKAIGVCREIKRRKLRVRIDAMTHVGINDPELYSEMKDAGFISIGIGAESGSDEVLKGMDKRQTIAQLKQTVEVVKKSGLDVFPFFMIGNILETKKSLEETLELAKYFNSNGNISYAQPFPGTRFREQCAENGRLVNTDPKTYWGLKIAFIPKGLSWLHLTYYHIKISMALKSRPHWLKRLLVKMHDFIRGEGVGSG